LGLKVPLIDDCAPWRKPPGNFAPIPIAVFVVVGVVLLIQVSAEWIPTPDAAQYLSMARSLASGNGLTRFGDPHLFHAPGYAVVISPAFWFSTRPFLALSIIHWLLLLAFMAGTYFWLREQLPDHAVAMTVLCVMNVGVLYCYRRTLSEALFMPLLMWTSVLMDKAAAELRAARALLYSALSAGLMGYLCFVRQTGVTLAGGFVLLVFLKALKREIDLLRAMLLGGLVAGTALVVAALLLFHDREMALLSPNAKTYIDFAQARDMSLGEQLIFGLRLQIQEIGRVLVPGAFKAYGGWFTPIMALYIPVVGAVMAGWYVLLAERPNTLLWAFPLYVLVHVAWAFDSGARFITPMVPVLWVSLWALVLRSKWKHRAGRFALLLILLSALTSAIYLVKDRMEVNRLSAYWPLAERVLATVPQTAALAVLDIEKPFSIICSFVRDRPCERLSGEAAERIPESIRYLIVAGKKSVPAFDLIESELTFSVMRRSEAQEAK
jgi:hypothetical protein